MSPTKILLSEDELPTRWYNVLHDLPTPPPPVLHPGTGQPVGPDDLAPLFPLALILQEVSQDQYIDIPAEVLEVYRLWRPSPMYRAHRLEKALGTPARIYYKYEGVPRPGSRSSLPRPAPGNGVARWPSPARSSTSSARSGRFGRRTTRSRTGA
jgi:tryptophan synthase beta chain